MAKATEPVTTNPSRRVLLAGVPAAAVTVAWGRERALSKPATGDDAELLALKAKFDPVFAKWVAQKIADREEHKSFVGLYERETRLKWDDRPAIDWNDPTWVACNDAMNRCNEIMGRYEEDRDEDDEYEGLASARVFAWDELCAELNPLAADILSYNASTLDGLRLQLRALISAYNETWEPAGTDENDEPDHPGTRNFIESAAGFLGVPFPPF
jgi:hypothetical protein